MVSSNLEARRGYYEVVEHAACSAPNAARRHPFDDVTILQTPVLHFLEQLILCTVVPQATLIESSPAAMPSESMPLLLCKQGGVGVLHRLNVIQLSRLTWSADLA